MIPEKPPLPRKESGVGRFGAIRQAAMPLRGDLHEGEIRDDPNIIPLKTQNLRTLKACATEA